MEAAEGGEIGIVLPGVAVHGALVAVCVAPDAAALRINLNEGTSNIRPDPDMELPGQS